MRALLIVNPHATATTQRRKDLLAAAFAGSLELTTIPTEYRGHATELAAAARAEGMDVVIAHGGDGTVNEVTNGLLQGASGSRVPLLAIVPGGATNVFARAIGIDSDPTLAAEQILDGLRRGRTRVVSLGKVNGRYFTFNAGLGLDAQVVRAVETHRARGKKISNSLHIRRAIAEFLRFNRRIPQLTVSSEHREPTDVFVALVSNVSPWSYASGRPVRTNPGLPADRGLGLLALRKAGLFSVLRTLRQLLFSGKGPRGRQILRIDNTDHIAVSARLSLPLHVDGDIIGEQSSAEFTSVPHALRVVI